LKEKKERPKTKIMHRARRKGAKKFKNIASRQDAKTPRNSKPVWGALSCENYLTGWI
jgi:hypothetical protein